MLLINLCILYCYLVMAQTTINYIVSKGMVIMAKQPKTSAYVGQPMFRNEENSIHMGKAESIPV